MPWIRAALDDTGTATIRYRRLPAELVVQTVVAMGLYRGRSMSEVVESLDLALPEPEGKFIAKSAITQARQKLGSAPMEAIFRKSAREWSGKDASKKTWNGLTMWVMDGTTLKVPDTPENRNEFGGQLYPSGKVSSYPQVRLVTLASLPTRLMVDVAFGAYGVNEMRYADRLIKPIQDNSITLFDKGFYAAALLLALASSGKERHFLIPAHVNFRHAVAEVEGSIDDVIVTTPVSPQARKQNPEYPKEWTMRMVQTTDSAGRVLRLLTSLLDRKRYPAKEILELYRRRWDAEIAFREFKTTMDMGKETLRSESPELVRQEIWGKFIAYNLVRLESAGAAHKLDAPLSAISFTRAFHCLQDRLVRKAGGRRDAPDYLVARRHRQLGRVLNKPVPGRKCPRVVKAKAKKYPEKWVRAPRGAPVRKRSA